MTTAIVPSPRILAVGRIQGQSPIEWKTQHQATQDAYTLGRSRYYAGQRLEDCATVAERCGYTSAEADGRRAELRAMLDVSFDEWQLHRAEYDADGAW